MGKKFYNCSFKIEDGFKPKQRKPVKYYSSDRIAQLMGNGLLTFIHEKTCFSDFLTKMRS